MGIVKDEKRTIAKIEANIKANELEYETEMDQLEENLEDAKDAEGQCPVGAIVVK